jgi:hypothetical protein
MHSALVEVENCGDETWYAFSCVLVDVTLKKPPLNLVVQSLIGEVDAEVIQGVGSAGHVLGAQKVEEVNESGKIITAQTLVDVLIQPSKEQRVKRFGEVISVVGRTIWVKEHRA